MRGHLLLCLVGLASALTGSTGTLKGCPTLSSTPQRSAAPSALRPSLAARPGAVASILPVHAVTNKLFSVPLTEATMFATSLIATAPGFNNFVHFFSSGYGLAMAGMAGANLAATMITTPAALLHNIGCAVHGSRLAHFVLTRDSWKERDANIATLNAKFDTVKRAKVWACYSLLYTMLYTPCFAHIRNPSFAQSLIPKKAHAPLVGLGLVVQWGGIALEAAADAQKQEHKHSIAAAKKKDTWFEGGLYSKTRHPNYLGEQMVHTGSLLCGLPAMTGVLQVAAAVAGSAGIALSLKAGAKKYDAKGMAKYGKDKKYKAYVERTGSMLPKFV